MDVGESIRKLDRSPKVSYGDCLGPRIKVKRLRGTILKKYWKEKKAKRNCSKVPCESSIAKYRGVSNVISVIMTKILDGTHVCKRRENFQPDVGWAWVVCAVGFISMLGAHLPLMSYGVLYAPVFEKYNVSSTKIAWINAILGASWDGVTIFLGPLCSTFSWRGVGMVGSGLVSLSLILSAYIPTPSVLFFYYSIIGGIGSGTSVAISFFVLSNYFHKRRGMAIAINSLGACVALLVGPPVSFYLNEHFGNRYACLIMGSVLLFQVPLAILYRPIEQRSHSVLQKTGLTSERDSITEDAEALNTLTVTQKKGNTTLLQVIIQVSKNTLKSLTLVKQRRVSHICISAPFIFLGYVTFQIWIPFVIRDKGHSLETAAACMSASAASNMIGRILLIILSDRTWFNRVLIFKFHLISLAASILFFAFSSNIYWLLFCVCWWGLNIGVLMVLYPLVMIDIMGLESFPSVFGIAQLCTGLGSLIIAPVIGLVKDNSSSFEIPLSIISIFVGFASALWLTLPYAANYDKKCENNGNLSQKVSSDESIQ